MGLFGLAQGALVAVESTNCLFFDPRAPTISSGSVVRRPGTHPKHRTPSFREAGQEHYRADKADGTGLSWRRSLSSFLLLVAMASNLLASCSILFLVVMPGARSY